MANNNTKCGCDFNIKTVGNCDISKLNLNGKDRANLNWTEISVPEILNIPELKPDIEGIDQVYANVILDNVKLIETPFAYKKYTLYSLYEEIIGLPDLLEVGPLTTAVDAVLAVLSNPDDPLTPGVVQLLEGLLSSLAPYSNVPVISALITSLENIITDVGTLVKDITSALDAVIAAVLNLVAAINSEPNNVDLICSCVQYIYYIRDLLHFDLGTSIRTSRPVLDDLARCYPATLELALFSIVIASVFGILFGIISAIRRNSILDQIVRAISVTGVSIPAFWFALLMLYFFYYKLKIFPGPGRLSNSFSAPASVTGMYVIDSLIEGNPAKAMDAIRHLILPSIVLAAFTMGLITRTTRSNLLDALSTDYVRTAKAKGLNSLCLILKHALGNALIPVMTVIGLGLGNLLGGMVLVETIFKWPGVGQFAYESVMAADYPAIIGVALLIALNYMIINTVVDILYGIIDPRVRCN